MLLPRRAVERARCDQDAPLGEPGQRVHRRLAARAPQVQPGRGLLDGETGGREPLLQLPASLLVPAALREHRGVVGQCRHSGGLDGARHDQTEVFAQRHQTVDQGGIAGDEAEPVTGQVAALGQRMHREQAGGVAVAHVGVQDRQRRRIPAQIEVALVRRDEHVVGARPLHDGAQLLEVEYPPGRVGRRIQPDHADAARRDGLPAGGLPAGGRSEHTGRGQRAGQVGAQHLGARHPGAHLIGGIGQVRDDDDIAGTQPELCRERGHQLLRADRRQHVLRVDIDAVRTVQPCGVRGAQRARAVHLRVAGRVGRVGQCGADGHRDPIDRGADGQVHQTVRVLGSARLRRGDRVPRKVRQGDRGAAAWCAGFRHGNRGAPLSR